MMDMRKGRAIFYCTTAFLFGNLVGGWINIPSIILYISSLLFIFLSLNWKILPFLLMSLFFLGSTSLRLSEYGTNTKNTILKIKAYQLKTDFSDHLEKIIPPGNELSILKALAIGEKRNISDSLKKSYKESGAMHLLALSGLHVGIIYLILSNILSIIGNSITQKKIKSICIILFLWFFAIITGLSSSICRAVIMITVYEISGFFSADRNFLCSLSISALLITLFNPSAPRNIGFQLSYCAVLSIFFIYPRLNSFLKTQTKIVGYIWKSVSLSISCQIVTTPLILYHFGSYPVYFLITNLLAIPLTEIIIYLIIISLLTFDIPIVGKTSAYLLEKVIHILNKIIITISEL